VLTHTATVPDTELQTYLNACDAVVLPHRTVLNSGGLQLAWSFGRPVIARRAGCLTGQVAEPAGRLFDGQDELRTALRAIDQLRTGAARRASYERAVAYPYTAMSEEFCALVSKLVTEVP
jgi:glycosyltransferase involved in cell wall biosynthesis